MKKIVIMIVSALLFTTVSWAQQIETIQASDLPQALNGSKYAGIQYGFSRNGYWQYGLSTRSGKEYEIYDQWIRVYRGNQKAFVEKKVMEQCEKMGSCEFSFIDLKTRKFTIVTMSLGKSDKECWSYSIAQYKGFTILVRQKLIKPYNHREHSVATILGFGEESDRRIDALIELINTKNKPFRVEHMGASMEEVNQQRNKETW